MDRARYVGAADMVARGRTGSHRHLESAVAVEGRRLGVARREVQTFDRGRIGHPVVVTRARCWYDQPTVARKTVADEGMQTHPDRRENERRRILRETSEVPSG